MIRRENDSFFSSGFSHLQRKIHGGGGRIQLHWCGVWWFLAISRSASAAGVRKFPRGWINVYKRSHATTRHETATSKGYYILSSEFFLFADLNKFFFFVLVCSRTSSCSGPVLLILILMFCARVAAAREDGDQPWPRGNIRGPLPRAIAFATACYRALSRSLSRATAFATACYRVRYRVLLSRYRVLLFCGSCYRVLPRATACYRVLPRFLLLCYCARPKKTGATACYRFYRVLPGSTGCYRVLPRATNKTACDRYCRVLLKKTACDRYYRVKQEKQEKTRKPGFIRTIDSIFLGVVRTCPMADGQHGAFTRAQRRALRWSRFVA